MPQTKSVRTPRGRLCASLRSRNAHEHLKKAILCEGLQEKCCPPEVRHTFCASLRNRNAHGHLRKSHVMPEFTGKMPPHNLGARFARACAVEMHMDISEGSFYARMNRKKCRRPEHEPGSKPGLNSYRKKPSVWTRCLGIIYIYTPVLTESYKVIIDLSPSGGQHISPRFAWMSRHQSLGGSRLVIFTTGREELCSLVYSLIDGNPRKNRKVLLNGKFQFKLFRCCYNYVQIYPS